MGRPATISREELLETAARLFAERGFDGATLADIAAPLGVTPAAILRYVESKEALFIESMAGGAQVGLPAVIEELAAVDAASDPRRVLRHLAEEFIPFVRNVIARNIVVYMHVRRSVVLPFDPSRADSPPRRGLKIVTDYFRRARRAGVVRIADPRAAALLFIGSLHSYVFLHEIVGVEPVHPVGRYIDSLIDLWTRGGIAPRKRRSRARKETPPSRPSRRSGGSGGVVVRPHEPPEGTDPRRNPRSEARRGGVAGRRSRRRRSC